MIGFHRRFDPLLTMANAAHESATKHELVSLHRWLSDRETFTYNIYAAPF
jgi:hypothetical protein